MAKITLTTKRVARLLKQPGRYRDADVRGLMLVVANQNNASWTLRYERHGKERWLGLGPARLIGVKQARERARAARLQLLDGIDPLEAKREKKRAEALAAAKAITFKEAAVAYFNQHEKKWRNRNSRAQFLSTLEAYAHPVIGGLSVADVDTGLVLKCIEPHWHAKPETMSRVCGRIERVLDWCTVRGYRSGDNPARWRGHIGEVLPARRAIQKPNHYAALPYADLPEFLVALNARSGVAAKALEFLILTAARTGEAVGARWDEVDLTNGTWTVPAGRMKGGREHRVPLSAAALALLGSLPTEEGNLYVFINGYGRGLSAVAPAQVLQRMGRTDITVHGFRSTFRDWAAERTNYPNHVVEMALAHKIASGVEAAYRRGDLFDKRKQLMEAWARYCSQPAKAGEVIPLRASP